MIPEIQEMLDEFVKELEELRTKTLLSGEYDGCNAILKLNAGAGGTEAMDWCSMLYRMYQRWADKKGFTTEVLDFLDGDEAGLKSITLQVNGEKCLRLPEIGERCPSSGPYFPVQRGWQASDFVRFL